MPEEIKYIEGLTGKIGNNRKLRKTLKPGCGCVYAAVIRN